MIKRLLILAAVALAIGAACVGYAVHTRRDTEKRSARIAHLEERIRTTDLAITLAENMLRIYRGNVETYDKLERRASSPGEAREDQSKKAAAEKDVRDKEREIEDLKREKRSLEDELNKMKNS